MPLRTALCSLLVPAALVGAACGAEDIDAGAYTCGEFKRSLDTKDDNTAGQFIRLLNDRAKIGGKRAVQERRMAYAIYVACRGRKASYKPATDAVAVAKAVAQGKRVVPRDVAERERRRGEKAAREADDRKPAE